MNILESFETGKFSIPDKYYVIGIVMVIANIISFVIDSRVLFYVSFFYSVGLLFLPFVFLVVFYFFNFLKK